MCKITIWFCTQVKLRTIVEKTNMGAMLLTGSRELPYPIIFMMKEMS